jgi:hypothetical protein
MGRPHTRATHSQPCYIVHCDICDGGLFSCAACGCAEGTLPTECPGAPVPWSEQERIYGGVLDFIDGAWLEKAAVQRARQQGREGD